MKKVNQFLNRYGDVIFGSFEEFFTILRWSILIGVVTRIIFKLWE